MLHGDTVQAPCVLFWKKEVCCALGVLSLYIPGYINGNT